MPCIPGISPTSDADTGIHYRPDTASEHLMLLCVLLKDFSGSSRDDGKLSAAVDPTNRWIRKQQRNAGRKHKSQRRIRTRRYHMPCRTLTVLSKQREGLEMLLAAMDK